MPVRLFPFRRRPGETDPVVGHHQADPAVDGVEADHHRPGPGVLLGVEQRLPGGQQQDLGPALLEGGQVAVERSTGATSVPKLFAGGDCIRGGGEIVDAVQDGKIAAWGIHAALSGG